MTTLEYLLDGLEAELALERELGVRLVECDRSLLVPPAKPKQPPAAVAAATADGKPSSVAATPSARVSSQPPARPTAPAARQEVVRTSAGAESHPFVFVHDRPLSPAGADMVERITKALGETSQSAPVVVEPPFPRARVTVILGGRALRKWFPGRNAAPGQWIDGIHGEDALVSYSPEYILRLSADGDEIKKIKRRMWTDLKAAHRKAKGETS